MIESPGESTVSDNKEGSKLRPRTRRIARGGLLLLGRRHQSLHPPRYLMLWLARAVTFLGWKKQCRFLGSLPLGVWPALSS